MPLEVAFTDLPDVLLLRPRRFTDDRGQFEETWNAEDFRLAVGRPVTFVQDNASVSAAGVLRGLHFQHPPFAQAKLVRCALGAIFDVAVDLRPTSPTYGRSFCTELTADSGWQLWIPEGFAHGFLALTPGTHVHYKCTAPYSPAHEGSLRWDDPHLAIPWPLTAPPLLSPKDAAAPGWGRG
jgi:dTDP-4-dehydrorhamnose 3,5-epimerase